MQYAPHLCGSMATSRSQVTYAMTVLSPIHKQQRNTDQTKDQQIRCRKSEDRKMFVPKKNQAKKGTLKSRYKKATLKSR